MDRRSRFAAFATAAFLGLVAAPQIAAAAPKDAAAKAMDQEAMNNDFLMADFPAAETKLKKAIDTCGASGCSPQVKAQILVHLGIVQVNQGNNAGGEQSFSQALAVLPSVEPEADFTTPEVAKVFEAAKQKTAAPPTTPTEPTTPPPAETPAGELAVMPVPEQMINTPVPVSVEVPEGMSVAKVIVMYKPFGGEWRKLELQKRRDSWQGLIPCLDVTTTGDLRFYVKALDAVGDQIAGAGTSKQPLVVKIKNQLDGEPPHLPNTPPPAQCRAAEDCPPGFPGCEPVRGTKGWGSSCEVTKECQEGLICLDGTCTEGEEDEDERPGKSGGPKRNWVGLQLAQDFAFLSGDDVCGQASQNDGYACFIRDGVYDGDQYKGNPIASGNGNAIASGLALSTTRILASYDRLFGKNFTAGARVGFAFRGGPQPDNANAFLPVHAEVRGAYWFGKDPFARKGIRPYVFVAGGMAQVDTQVKVSVREQAECAPNAEDVRNDPCRVENQAGEVIQRNPQTQELDAWRKSGQSFVAGGGGVAYAITPEIQAVFDLRANFMFPTTGFVLTPSLGAAYGF